MRIVITTSDEKAVDYLEQVVVPAVAEGFREGHHDAEHHWAVEQTPPDPATAEALGVRVHVTTSAGSDGAVLVLIDTDFEPDGSDGSGLRVRVNDEVVYAGVDYEPADESSGELTE